MRRESVRYHLLLPVRRASVSLLTDSICSPCIYKTSHTMPLALEQDCTLNILTQKDAEGIRTVRHTCSHVLAEAVKRLFPQAKLAIGPSIDEGFYYDFEAEPFSREDLDKLEKEMKKIIKEGNQRQPLANHIHCSKKFHLPAQLVMVPLFDILQMFQVCI